MGVPEWKRAQALDPAISAIKKMIVNSTISQRRPTSRDDPELRAYLHQRHAHNLTLQPGVLSSQVGQLWGGPLTLSLDKVVGFPQLLLGGIPGHIGVLPLVPSVATLLRELREFPRVKSDSRGDRAHSMPL